MSFSWSIKSSSFNFYWPYSTIYASNRPPWRRYYAVGLGKNPCFIFVQRACLNILPTRDNLHRRKLKVEPRCEFCCQQPKNVSHVLWECLSLEMFGQWSEGLGTPIGFFLFLFFSYCFGRDKQVRPARELEIWTVIAWSLWKTRNKFYFEKIHLQPKAE